MGDVVDSVTSAVVTGLSEHINLSRAHKRMQTLARVLICTTFLEDSLRMVTSFQSQVLTIAIVAQSGSIPLPPESSWMVVVISALLQFSGAMAVIFERREIMGCVALIVWCCVHPALYAQMRNGEFVSETVSVIGGLCILTSHLGEMRAARYNLLPSGPAQLPGAPASDRLCLLGRVLLCAYFIYYFLTKMAAVVGGQLKLHTALVESVMMVLLAYMCALIIVGSHSRRVALSLAVVMFVSNLVFHPFWYFWMVGHQFITKADMNALSTRLPVNLEGIEASQNGDGGLVSLLDVADHEQYFFFQRLSTVGALILLAVHGPGRHSVDEPRAPVRIERFIAKGRD